MRQADLLVEDASRTRAWGSPNERDARAVVADHDLRAHSGLARGAGAHVDVHDDGIAVEEGAVASRNHSQRRRRVDAVADSVAVVIGLHGAASAVARRGLGRIVRACIAGRRDIPLRLIERADVDE